MNWEEEILLGKTALNKGLITTHQFQEASSLFRELGGQIPFSGILIQRGYITMEQAKYLQESLNQEGRLGEYRLMEKLGEGGMGAVYRAIHIPTREIRALKILLPQVSRDVQIVQRFIQEGRAASLLNHPGVVKCYEVKRWNTTFYMAMEYVQGESLDKVIERKGFLRDRAWTTEEIAAALATRIDAHRTFHRTPKMVEGLSHAVRQDLEKLCHGWWQSLNHEVDQPDFLSYVNGPQLRAHLDDMINPAAELACAAGA